MGKEIIQFSCLGFFTGLRISDILNLKVSDVKGKLKADIVEKKTGKEKNTESNAIDQSNY
jgi:integrase